MNSSNYNDKIILKSTASSGTSNSYLSFPSKPILNTRDLPHHDAMIMNESSAFKRARKRYTALLLTLCIEMIVALVVSRFTSTLTSYPLLVSFMPVVSAISGNVGLQSSSIVTRALAVGLMTKHDYIKSMISEISCAIYLGLYLGLMTGIIAGVWQGWWIFGFIIGLSQFSSICFASITGSLAPLIGKSLGFDPAAFAGPLETAAQDIIGNSLFLVFSSALLDNFDRKS